MDVLKNVTILLREYKEIDRGIQYFFPGKCLDVILFQLDFFNAKCAPILASRFLGFLITLGSCFLLVPQILKIYFAGSTRGISFISQALALFAAVGNAAYSYERRFVFGQWGDSMFVSIQIAIVVMQILYYNYSAAQSVAFMSFCWSIGIAIRYHLVPMKVLEVIQALTIPIIFLSKGTQIVENFKNCGTGQLSIISVTLQFVGCLARIFTSVQETGSDFLIVASFVIASVFNGILLCQIIVYGYYWNKRKSDEGRKMMQQRQSKEEKKKQ